MISELSVEQILNKYQGFEGELIALFSIEEDSQLNNIIEKCLEIKSSNNYLMLSVISDFQVIPSIISEQTLLVGYDVGVCEKEKTIYSSIFNEILFGSLNELIIYKQFLNEHLLFPNKSWAEKYVKLHNELSSLGKDVEDYEEMNIYEIWKYNI